MKLYLCAATAFLFGTMPVSAQSVENTTTSVVSVPVGDDAPKQEGIKGTIALGGADVPKYDGASKYRAAPFGLIALKFKSFDLNLVGPTMKLNFGGDSHFEFGPVIGLSGGRSESDAVGRVKLLNTISTSANAGAYVGYRFGGSPSGQGRIVFSLEATQDVKGSRGFTIEPSVNYIAIRNRHMFLNFDVSTKINDAKYMQTNFGITPLEALRSGFAAYRPSGGISSVQGGATGGYQLTRHWGLLARAQAGTYLGHASDSPIVKDGSKSFHQFALGLGYTF